MTGISILAEGIGVARIVRDGTATPPKLTVCEYFPTPSPAERPAILNEIAAKFQLDSAACTSLMDANNTNLLLVEAPEVDPTELKAAVRWRIKDLIDFHIDDAVIDVFDIEGQRQRGRANMMYVVVARFSAVREHIDLLENARVGLNVIDIPELAQRNIAALLKEDQNGVALLHFSPHSGLLTITRQGSLFLARTLEFGSDHLGAESSLPANFGDDDAANTTLTTTDTGLSAGLQRLLDSIVLEVQRSLDYYESHFGLPPVSGLVIAPTEQAVPGMLGYLSHSLGLPVRLLDLNTVLDSEQTIDDVLQARCFAAIGAALRVEERAL